MKETNKRLNKKKQKLKFYQMIYPKSIKNAEN
jgi:hypothetical protein